MSGPVVFIKDPNPPWEQCIELEALIIKYAREGKLQSPEFQHILSFFGKERCRQILVNYARSLKAGEAEVNTSQGNGNP